MSSSAIPPLPAGYKLDRQSGVAHSGIPPVPTGYQLDHPPLPPGYKLDQPQSTARFRDPWGSPRPAPTPSAHYRGGGSKPAESPFSKNFQEAVPEVGKGLLGLGEGLFMGPPGMAIMGMKHGWDNLQSVRQTGKTLEQRHNEVQRAAGYGPFYRYLSTPLAEGIGVPVRNIEQNAKEGKTGAIWGDIAVPLATAVAPIAGRGAMRAPAVEGILPESAPMPSGVLGEAAPVRMLTPEVTPSDVPPEAEQNYHAPQYKAAPAKAPRAPRGAAVETKPLTPEQEAVRTTPEWVRNPETGKMELASEASEAAKTEPEPAAKASRRAKVSERPDPQDRPVTSNRPKTPKDRSLQGTQEQLEGVGQYQKIKIKQGKQAGEEGEQPGGYNLVLGKSDQGVQQPLDKIRSLEEAEKEEERKNAEEDKKAEEPGEASRGATRGAR